MPDTNETREQIQARIAQATQNFNTYKENYQDEVTDPNGAASASAARSHEWAESDNPITIAGDDNQHYSSKHWAGEADQKVDQYAEYMNEQGKRLDYLLRTLPVVPDNPVIPGTDRILSDKNIDVYLKQHCHPIYSVPQGKVYLSRVPWGRKDVNGNIQNGTSAIASGSLAASKLMDNINPETGVPLQHVPSTDTVLGSDDYVGREWPFFWQRCNYMADVYGVKHITAIEGTPTDNMSGEQAIFSEDKNTGVFGPKFWCVCALDLGKDTDGDWLTHNGNKPVINYGAPWLDVQDPTSGDGGIPLYQLWGISDVPFDSLSDDRKLELIKHGIYGPTEETWEHIEQTRSQEYKDALLERDIYTQDSNGNYVLTGGYRLNLWSECKQWDPDANEGNGDWVERPYWVHSAYMGGYAPGTASAEVVSKINVPPYNNVSQNTLVDKPYQYEYPEGWDPQTPLYAKHEGARVQAFGVLFDIVKNATKHSQGLHAGICNFDVAAQLATYDTAEKGRIFPTSNTSFVVGGTVRLWKTNTSSEYTPGAKSLSNQWGRVIAIENRTFLTNEIDEATGEYKQVTARCLVFDPDSCDEFYVRKTAAEVDALVEQGYQACCYGTMGPAMAGETYAGGAARKGVIGKHDGSVVSRTDNKHAYRVQGTEYCTGHLMLCPELIAAKVSSASTGKPIEFADGSVYNLKSSDYVYFYASPVIARKKGLSWTTTAPYHNATGYVPVGVTPSQTSNYAVNGWMDTVWGVTYPVLLGSSSSQGHQDYFYAGGNPGEYLTGCSLDPNYYQWGGGSNGGSLYVYVYGALSTTYWGFGSRD